MKPSAGTILFQLTDWNKTEAIESRGESGFSSSKTIQSGNITLRIVEYSENYLADHWCSKGHLAYCIEGECTVELSDGTKHKMVSGVSFQVSDNVSSHKLSSKNGAILFIIDGEFLSARR